MRELLVVLMRLPFIIYGYFPLGAIFQVIKQASDKEPYNNLFVELHRFLNVKDEWSVIRVKTI